MKLTKFTEIIEDSDEDALVVGHAFAARTADWIIDSGATSHMCTSRHLFTDYRCLQLHEKFSLGDGRSLEVVGRGTVAWWSVETMSSEDVPDFSYNLISVSKGSEGGKMAEKWRSLMNLGARW